MLLGIGHCHFAKQQWFKKIIKRQKDEIQRNKMPCFLIEFLKKDHC